MDIAPVDRAGAKREAVIMGAALAPWLNALPRRKRLGKLLFLSDPNFADSSVASKAGERDVGVLAGGGLVTWFGWITGTAMGAGFCAGLGDLHRFGIDALMVCYFVALIVGSTRHQPVFLQGTAAVAVAILARSALPPGWNIVAAALTGGVVGVLVFDRSEADG